MHRGLSLAKVGHLEVFQAALGAAEGPALAARWPRRCSAGVRGPHPSGIPNCSSEGGLGEASWRPGICA